MMPCNVTLSYEIKRYGTTVQTRQHDIMIHHASTVIH